MPLSIHINIVLSGRAPCVSLREKGLGGNEKGYHPVVQKH
jgi:hypothetical protein